VHVLAASCIVASVADAVDIVAEMSRVFASRDWPAMRALYHPDALILTVTGGPEPLGPDEVVAELERVSGDFVYSVRGSQPLALDERAAIVTGRMRRRMETGGYEEAGHVWLLTVRDGLIYRQGVYSDVDQARAEYERLGLGLGVE
jgi:ketosteroid isomerase-like protein